MWILFACKKDNNNNPVYTPNPAAELFSASVNGTFSQADSSEGWLNIDSSLGIPIRTFLIAGNFQNHIIVCGFGDISTSEVLTVQSYDSLAAGAGIQFYSSTDTVNDFDAIEARFALTMVDTANKKVSGNFSGILVGDVTGDTVSISDGTFTNIIYQVQ